jgi:predicted GNAT family acetyltransferase
MEPPAAIELRKDETNRLYEALIDGEVVGTLAYETTGGRVSLSHSYVDENHRHRGVGSALARYALEDLRRSQSKPDIYCGFVADYVEDHPEWKDAVDIHYSGLIATRTSRDINTGQ